jgi:hypothetical protein
MLGQNASMRTAQQLLWALEGLKVKPPKVLQNIAAGFELLGAPIQPAAADPAEAIITAAVDGKLTPKSLDELLTTAAAENTTNNYRQEFRLKAERKFVRQFHAALVDGAADEILDALRPQFDATAAELTTARDAVDVNATPERLFNVTATAGEQEAWRKLPELVRQIDRLGAIAAALGPHAELAVVDNLTKNDSLLNLGWLGDRALMCCEGNLVTASNAFRQANPTWQTSPWLRVTLKLATIAEAQEKVREAAEGDFAARESQRSGRGTLTAEQGFVPDIQANPHKLPEPAKA